jgi:hypothetical protein
VASVGGSWTYVTDHPAVQPAMISVKSSLGGAAAVRLGPPPRPRPSVERAEPPSDNMEHPPSGGTANPPSGGAAPPGPATPGGHS